ncbi:hypothetical protein [Shewanella sp. GXUN23E]|uniref:hypothetical protein n=1 Tax=Shewanella sp. GXUN23E TaxID=3422498 RepID=UPI003D7C9715
MLTKRKAVLSLLCSLMMAATIQAAQEPEQKATDAAKRKGEQQHQAEVATVKGLKQQEIQAHEAHKRKGEQQYLKELQKTKPAVKKDN